MQSPVRSLARRIAAVMLAASATVPAIAQMSPPAPPAPPPAPQNVVTLAASATIERSADWLTVVFGTTREGSDAPALQSQLRQALDAALAEARRAARPGEVLVHTGGFSLHPRYAPKGGLGGWQGSTELVVEGRDAAAIAQLVGRIQTLSVVRVGWSLSREAREQVESEATAQAIARFRAKAEAVAREFGLGGYVLREASVMSNEPGPRPVPMLRAQAMRAAAAEEALPVEAGRVPVSVTVNGSVQLR